MAQIPTFERLGETPTPRPSGAVVPIRATSDAELAPFEAIAQTGSQLEAASTSLQNMVKQEEDRANTVRVEDAWNQYQNAALETLRGENGVLNLKAGVAVNSDVLGTTSRSLDAARRKIASTLVNDEQRLRFNQRADVTDLRAKHDVLVHHANEQRAFQKQTLDNTVVVESANAATYGDEPGMGPEFRRSIDRVQRAGDAYMRSIGHTGEIGEQAIAQYKKDLSDGMWVSRIKGLMFPDPTRAQKMLTDNVDQIHNPEVLAKLRAEIKNGAIPFTVGKSAETILDSIRKSKISDVADRTAMASQAEAMLAKNPNDSDALMIKALLETPKEDIARGIPSAKMEAAKLPIALALVEPESTRLYGADRNNVDRQAFADRLRNEIRQRNAQDVQQLNAIQNANYETAFGIVMKPELEGTKDFKTLAQHKQDPAFARSWDMMAAQGQAAIVNAIDRQHNKQPKGNPEFVQEMQERITRPIEAEGAINSWMQIQGDPRYRDLNNTQVSRLMSDFKAWQDADGRNYLQRRKLLDSKMKNAFRAQPSLLRFGGLGQQDYSVADEALLAWQTELAGTVAKYNAANKPIGPLFDPSSKEYGGTPGEVERFTAQVSGAPGKALSTMAQQQRQGESAKMPDTVKTPEQVRAWVSTLPANVSHAIGPDGNAYDIRGLRQPQATAPAAHVAPSAPQGAIVLDPSGELRQVPTTQPAPAQAPAASLKPADPSEDEQMPKMLTPSTVAKRIERFGERGAIIRQRRAERVNERLPELLAALRRASIATIPFVGISNAVVDIMAATTDPAGRALGRAIPTELQRIQVGFRDIVKRGFTEADQDVIQASLDIGEPFFTPLEMKKARFMLDELKK